jgi:hypothetical protein
MTTTVATIATTYRGTVFRSRLEARWAVFFDRLGVRWEYEAEGFELPDGPYLPDFLLPDVDSSAYGGRGVWLELKGAYCDETFRGFHPYVIRRAEQLSALTNCPVYLFVGPPLRWLDGDGELDFDRGGDLCLAHGGDWPYFPCLCPKCRRFGFEFSGWGERVCGGRCTDGRVCTANDARIVQAGRAALAHRFW